MEGLSVVMPTLGHRATLPRALARLRGQEGLREVLLAADAAADHGAVERAWSAASLPGPVVRGAVPGASAARNEGWRAARGAVVLFLDDDVLAEPGLAAAHAREHGADPAADLAVLGGVRWEDGLRVSAFMRWIEGLQFDFAAMEPGALTGWWHFYTANASVKRAALEQVRGFDAQGRRRAPVLGAGAGRALPGRLGARGRRGARPPAGAAVACRRSWRWPFCTLSTGPRSGGARSAWCTTWAPG